MSADGESPTQWKVLVFLAHYHYGAQVAGHGRAPWLSAARALVRKGLATASTRTGHYAISDAGRQLIRASGRDIQPTRV